MNELERKVAAVLARYGMSYEPPEEEFEEAARVIVAVMLAELREAVPLMVDAAKREADDQHMTMLRINYEAILKVGIAAFERQHASTATEDDNAR